MQQYSIELITLLEDLAREQQSTGKALVSGGDLEQIKLKLNETSRALDLLADTSITLCDFREELSLEDAASLSAKSSPAQGA